MPLFGKKKSDEQKKAEEAKKNEASAGGGSYPRQTSGPSASGYPTAPPPAYTPVQQPLPGQGGHFVPQNPPVVYPVQMPSSGGPQPPPYQPVQQTYACSDASFEAGARFGPRHGGARPTVPPPPPGVMPNTAQMVAAQGHNVVVGQREQTVFGGTGDAGAVLW